MKGRELIIDDRWALLCRVRRGEMPKKVQPDPLVIEPKPTIVPRSN